MLFLLSFDVYATTFADVKFGQSQIADSQWNVGACMYTATCQIYSKAPGTAYKIPWTSGKLSWASGDYVSFVATGNSTNPWQAIQYNSSGTQKAVMGNGHVINMGADYFFFVGYDNNTGQLFSPTIGMSGTVGVTWAGTLNPTVGQMNAAATNWTTTPLTAGQTYTSAPSLCCGGSGASFNHSLNFDSRVLLFQTRTSADSQVYIEQIGDSNTIVVQQQGTKNNYAKYIGNGYNNNIDITQLATNPIATDYAELTINGNSNNVTLTQQSSGGTKSLLVQVSNNNNIVNLEQKDNGSHYAEITLNGGYKSVNVLQQGSAAHQAKIELLGLPTNLSLTQSGNSQQFYSINFNCATAGGCQAIQVQQGN